MNVKTVINLIDIFNFLDPLEDGLFLSSHCKRPESCDASSRIVSSQTEGAIVG